MGLPLFWDEMLVYFEPLYNLHKNGISYLKNPSGFFHHPPGVQLMAWPVYALAGQKIFALKLFTLLMSLGTCVWLYKIATHFGSKLFALLVVGSYFFTPIIFTQASMVLGDTYLCFWASMYLYFALKKDWLHAMVTGFIMGLTRETSLAFAGGLLIFLVLQKNKNKLAWLAVATPFLAIALFFIFEFAENGSIFNHIAFQDQDIALTSGKFLLQFNHAVELFLWIRSKWYLTLAGFLFIPLFPFFKGRIKNSHDLLLILLPSFILLIFMSFNSGVLERYFNPVWGTTLILLLLPIFRVIQDKAIFLLPFIILLHSQFYFDEGGHPGTGHEDILEHKYVAKNFIQLGDYLQKNYPTHLIYTQWPIYHALKDPSMGYVNKSLQVTNKKDAHFTLYIYSNNSPMHSREVLAKDKSELGLSKVKEFKNRGKVIEVYRRRN